MNPIRQTKIKHKKTGVAIYGKRRRGRIEEQHKAVQPLIDRKTVPSKAESKTLGISSTTRRPPKSKLPPEKGKDYLYTTPQEKEGIAKEIQQRPPQPYARVKNETFVNPPDKIPQPIPSAPSETSKLYDLLSIAFMKQVEANDKITKTINNITPEIQRTLNANIQPLGIGGRPLVVPYGYTEATWLAVEPRKRAGARTKAVNREK